jgi:hypothetical protein
VRRIWVLGTIAILTLHAADPGEITLRFAGKPAIRRVLQRTTSYLGGDVEITATIEARDAAGRLLPNLTVALSARTVKDGNVGRLRAYGFTDRLGLASSRIVFDLPISSLKTSLQACLRDGDVCTPVTEVDLTKRTDLEVHFTHQQVANAGSQRVVRLGKTEDLQFVAAMSGYQVRPRVIVNAWEQSGIRSLYSSLTFFCESALTVNRTGDAFPIPESTKVFFGQPAAGATVRVASRLQADVAYAPAFREQNGYSSATLVVNQPAGARNLVYGGVGISRANAPSAPDAARFGTEYGPQAGFTHLMKSGASRISGWAQYSFQGENRFVESGKPVLEPRQRSAAAGLSWAFHRGGPAYLQLDLFVGGLGGRAQYYGVSTILTLRNMVRSL